MPLFERRKHSRLTVFYKIIPVPFRQPSTVFQPTGAAGEADHVEPGSVPSSLTCNRPTLGSTRRGFAHKIVPNGVQLWRRLCSPLGVPPDDDDDVLEPPMKRIFLSLPVRTDVFTYSFFPRTITDWNSLPQAVCLLQSTQTLICVLVARPRRCLTLSNPVP